jgi:hypothetical protein
MHQQRAYQWHGLVLENPLSIRTVINGPLLYFRQSEFIFYFQDRPCINLDCIPNRVFLYASFSCPERGGNKSLQDHTVSHSGRQ